MTPMLCLLAEGKVFGLVGAIEHGVRGLLRGDRGDLHDAFHLRNGEVGDADPADFSFALEVGHGGPALFDVFVRLGPVDLVEVDGFDVETAEAVFALAADLLLGVGDFFFVVPDHGGLGEDVGFVRGGLEGAGDDFFGVAEAVDGGGVDPVDAEVEGFVDGGDGVVVVLRAPCEGPVAAADGPCSEADGGEVEV